LRIVNIVSCETFTEPFYSLSISTALIARNAEIVRKLQSEYSMSLQPRERIPSFEIVNSRIEVSEI